VVRLKSGDPAVFGRLGEELEVLHKAGVEFEIVPGITAASAAAAAAGITLTDRRAASSLVTLTAHTCRGEKLQTRGFDPKHSTFAIYMPGPDYKRTVRDLMESGVDAATPCVVVSNAGRMSEEIRSMSLTALGSASGIAAPAILIVGEVARAEYGQNSQPSEDAEKLFPEIACEAIDSHLPLSL
jgi:uroporphyrin-III C-methyltransferase/precorrin-2 dehydrogenase/sirohydrochlorin ferrochelatase